MTWAVRSKPVKASGQPSAGLTGSPIASKQPQPDGQMRSHEGSNGPTDLDRASSRAVKPRLGHRACSTLFARPRIYSCYFRKIQLLHCQWMSSLIRSSRSRCISRRTRKRVPARRRRRHRPTRSDHLYGGQQGLLSDQPDIRITCNLRPPVTLGVAK